MRVHPPLLFLVLPATIAGAATVQDRPKAEAANCPRTTSYNAGTTGAYRGKPLAPRKLTELPPGTAFMAVYRHIGPCEAPLTMAEYRNLGRR